ncbi:MAG: Spy/CpxP family protein refolding chaperone [Cytophagaceae bacterium]|nr:Spy/CpxP family protein refolding chaperone [Cytophagaceae bacterium]
MKPRTILLFGLFLLLSQVVLAQNRNGMQRIQSAKIALITNRLNLSPEQSQQFWAVYNEYEDKKMELRKSIRALNAETDNLTTTDERILSSLKEMMNLRQREVDLDKDYMNRFLKVINVRQLAELYKTEQQFTRMLIEKLNQRPNKGIK